MFWGRFLLALTAAGIVSCAGGNARDIGETDGREAEAESESEGEPAGCKARENCRPPEGIQALACDPVCQTGCPGQSACVLQEGEPVCALFESGVAACETGCAADLPCAAGATCRIEGASTICARYCWNDGDCPPDWMCNLILVAEPQTIRVCSLLEDCDPIANTGCVEGDGCYVVLPKSSCPEPATQCLDLGIAEEGGTCTFANACSPGLLCVDNFCRRLCIMNEDCGDGICQEVLLDCGSENLEPLASYGVCE